MPLTIGIGYLIGSVPFAWLLARRWGADVRHVGSGNVGAANVLRASGVTPAVLAALLDIGKGAASVFIAERVTGPDSAAPAAAGLAAIVGHVYPVWLGFRGGKGVATACGVFFVLAPAAAVAVFATFLVSVWMTRYISLGSVLASVALPPIAYATGSSAPVVGAATAAATLVVFRHRSNLARLSRGTEPRIGGRIADGGAQRLLADSPGRDVEHPKA